MVLSIYPSIYLPTYLSFFVSIFLSFYLSILIHLSVHLQGYSARLPQFSNLKPSKTQQFCETSSALELDNVKNETILRDFLNFRSCQHQKQAILSDLRPSSIMESWVQSWRPFQSMCLKYCSCHEKLRPDHTKCCTCHAKLFANLKIRNPAQEICTLIS